MSSRLIYYRIHMHCNATYVRLENRLFNFSLQFLKQHSPHNTLGSIILKYSHSQFDYMVTKDILLKCFVLTFL